MKRVVSERYVEEYSKCPLRIWPPPQFSNTPQQAAWKDSLAWLLLQSFTGQKVSLRVLQENLAEGPATLKSPERDEWLKKVPRHARGLIDLYRRFEVYQPVRPYMFDIEGLTVSGEYAVLRDSRIGLILLREWISSPAFTRPPDVLTMLRWWELTNRLGSCKKIVHVGMRGVRTWSTPGLDLSLVRQYVGRIMHSMRDQVYFPSAGSYCESCPTRSCEKVYV